MRLINTKEIKVKEYTDSEGYTYKYLTIEDLCGQIVCEGCYHYCECEKYNIQDCCCDYNETMKELKEKGIK